MRITMLTVGTRGDVQPLIAFGCALQRHGHTVRIATHDGFEPVVRAHGLDFAPLAIGAIGRGAETAEGRRWAEEAGRTPAWVAFMRDARSVGAQRLADARAACEDADVVVASNLGQLMGWQLATRLDLPLVRVLLHAPDYWMARSPTRPGVRAGRQLAWLAGRPWLRRVRRGVLDGPLPWRAPLMAGDDRLVLDLLPYSPTLFPPPDRQSAIAEVTGYWFLDGTLDPEPPAALEAFLAAGPPPVYVGFGTQPDKDPEATTRLVLDALRRAGRRGVLGRAAPDGVELGPDVVAVAAVSHTWLFPRCAAVAHHCGTGTVGAALRAGVPTVAVPHFSDQFRWAALLHGLGAASPPVARRKLTAAGLAAAIEATADPATVRRCGELRRVVEAEAGVAQAVAAFQRRVARVPVREAVAA